MFVLIAVVSVTGAHAGDCRTVLRSLLLSAQPDAAEIEAVRELCATEHAGGDADSGYHLALTYLGMGAWDPDRAVPMIREAAVAGVPEAQYWLAWQLEAGPLLPDDPAAALGWYEAAAEREHVLALRRLADAYALGELGLSVDERRAVELKALADRCARDAAGT